MPSSRPKPPARVNTSSTYTLAHTAQCKLKLAAKRTDRDLRFVLGHAFTLDNLMLRIVEIENREAKSAFTEGGKRSKDVSDADGEGEHFDCSLPNPKTAPIATEQYGGGGGDDDGDFDCTKAPPENTKEQKIISSHSPATGGGEAPVPAGGRRISFQDNNARPSKNGYGSGGSRSPRGRRSPSPQLILPAGLSDDSDDGTSSDDYEEPELMAYDCEAAPTVPEEKKALKRAKAKSKAGAKVRDTYVDEEEAALELADDELDTNTDVDADTDKLGDDMDGLGLDDEDEDEDDDGMGLTRFESASARPPRMIEDVEGDEHDYDDDDDIGPDSPPQLPADVDVREIIGGERDDELTDLYEKVRRCACHGNRDNVGGKPDGIWDVPVEKTGGRRLAVVAVAA